MTEEAREAMRAYSREWNRRNPEKRKQYNERYWAKKAAKNRAKEGEGGILPKAGEGGA